MKSIPIEYKLQSYERSNQDTSLVHTTSVKVGNWVQPGDLLADTSASRGGEFSIGQNLLIAYMPWEGYNYEDAILISDRLVFDDLYTSIHIEKYDIKAEQTGDKKEIITRQLPNLSNSNTILHLDKRGIVKVGTSVKEGDILVGKITPITETIKFSGYEKLFRDIMGYDTNPTHRDSSLRVPKGLNAKVIRVKILNYKKNTSQTNKSELVNNKVNKNKKTKAINDHSSFFKKNNEGFLVDLNSNRNINTKKVKKSLLTLKKKLKKSTLKKLNRFDNFLFKLKGSLNSSILLKQSNVSKKRFSQIKSFFSKYIKKKRKKYFVSQSLKSFSKTNKEPILVNVYLAQKRKIRVGDKIAGRHGNKGIISLILPRQDMPYLPDGRPLDLVLNPLGVPSRMNVGQIFECLLGLAGHYLNEQYRISPFDERYGPEASRSFVFNKLYEASYKTGNTWIFQNKHPGKIKLYDGRNGEPFHQPITVGQAYIIKLVHLVDDKIHSRSTGPYSLVTQQPLRGRSKQGGQRVGEMEVWAIEGYGAAFTLLELLSLKSDDVTGRATVWNSILHNKQIRFGTPASFNVLVSELNALCLNIGIYCSDENGNIKKESARTNNNI